NAGLGRARVGELFSAGAVRVVGADGRGRRAKKGDRAEAGTFIELSVGDADLARGALPDAEVALRIVLERADLVVVDKPAGVPSAPIEPGERGTIANGLCARYPEMTGIGF